MNSPKKTWPLRVGALLLAMALQAGQAEVQAQTFDYGVYVETPGEKGGGYSIANGPQCFIITAAHVVQDSDGELASSVTVRDVSGLKRSAQVVKESISHDLALLKIDDPAQFPCNRNWSDGADVRAAVRKSELKFLDRHNGAGDETRVPLTYVGNEGASKLKFLPAQLNPEYWAMQGDSGWPIFSMSGDLLGIALTVNSADGAVVALNQAVINAEFSNDVVSGQAYKVLAAQVSQNGRREHRPATLSLLQALESGGSGKIVVTERHEFYFGTSSWAGNIDARLARKAGAPSIPASDYLLEADIVQLDVQSAKVPIADLPVAAGVAEREVTKALLGSIFGDAGRDAARTIEKDQLTRSKATKRVMDVTLDLDLKITDTRTGDVVRYRQPTQLRVDTSDRDIAEAAALDAAFRAAIPALLEKAGL